MLLIFLFASIFFMHSVTAVDPLVDSKIGLIRGVQSEDGEYSMFLGVPYALVDENNPFGASTPHPGFETPFEAYNDTAVCPQMSGQTPIGTLQCLHLNIYVPNKATTKNLLPVMVWIHGGGFSIGSGNRADYSPELLIKHDVVLVFINYRLGPYGFLCLDSEKVSGNQGLKDQYLALKWVKENIRDFGGDPRMVTVFGESAGAVSIEFFLLSNRELLFQRAIMQSGSTLKPIAVSKLNNEIAFTIASNMGYETDNIENAIRFLSEKDSDLVIAATNEIENVYQIIRPCVDSGSDAVIPDLPQNLGNKKISGLNLMYGSNGEEMLAYYNKYFIKGSFGKVLEMGFENLNESIAQIIQQFYVGDAEFNDNIIPEFVQFGSDFFYNHPVERSMNKMIENGAKDIYYYVFNYSGHRNVMSKILNIAHSGATHGDELGYLFGNDALKDSPNEEDQLVIDRMTKMWTDFAKFGNPTPEISDAIPDKWKPVSTKKYYMNIDSNLTLKTRPFHDRMAFWDLVYKAVQNPDPVTDKFV